MPTKNPQENKTPTQAEPAQQAQWVNDLYQKHFDRSATPQEMQSWWLQGPQALDGFLGSEATRYGYQSNGMRAQKDENLKKAMDQIDNDPRIPPGMKPVAKDVVQNYKGDVNADYKSIMDTFNKIKTDTIDPHYAAQVGFIQQGLKASNDILQGNRSLEKETQDASASAAVRQEQSSLESRGLTSSGEAVRQLGQQSAVTQDGQPTRSLSRVPTDQQSFAQQGADGLIYDSRTGKPFVSQAGGQVEGLVPQQNRILASSSQLRYNQALNNLGQSAESQLGSGGVGMITGYNPSGGLIGSVEAQRQQDLGQRLSQTAQNQAAKNQANKNVSLNVSTN